MSGQSLIPHRRRASGFVILRRDSGYDVRRQGVACQAPFEGPPGHKASRFTAGSLRTPDRTILEAHASTGGLNHGFRGAERFPSRQRRVYESRNYDSPAAKRPAGSALIHFSLAKTHSHSGNWQPHCAGEAGGISRSPAYCGMATGNVQLQFLTLFCLDRLAAF